ncbi:MAG: malto-oligosyltrehalose synthase [Burkholderiales bacterium]|nr:malto-oligosyltrehalose synthase [Burkholderiales bacterium]
MSDPARLAELVRLHGIAPDYFDIWGNRHAVPEATLLPLLAAFGLEIGETQSLEAALAASATARWREILPPVVVAEEGDGAWKVRVALDAARDAARLGWRLIEEGGTVHEGTLVPADLPCLERGETAEGLYVAREFTVRVAPGRGYHRLVLVHADAIMAEASFVVAPAACYRPDALAGEGRVWGASVQLYGLRSERNWGIGDFTDLRTLLEQWAHRGAAIVGVNPLHALYPHTPAHASPYSPSSRLFLNVLYIDVEAAADFGECDEAVAEVRSAWFQARLTSLREAPLVDYPGVAGAKLPVLERLYAHFRARHLAAGTVRAEAFRAFQSDGGARLRRHALFEAIQERLHREDPSVWGWPAWPAAYQDPTAPAVARFAAEHAERVEFYEYLQWLAELQLGEVGRRSLELGLGIGLYQDLAVSIDGGGAEAWANQDLYAVSATVGAPPDDFNAAGQNWGLPPIRPERLREVAYAPFIATLRENMRHAGALRIDHVMGLMRLFWIPAGRIAAEGAYVHYPFSDLLGILALESHRNRCLVIGEDLGTVPDEVRDALGRLGVLSYRLLFFERTGTGDFKLPAAYPADALVAASTHDLPTLAGYWEGRDILLRQELGLTPSDDRRQAQIVERAQDRARLLLALEREGLLPQGTAANPVSVPEMTPEFARNLHVYLARAPAKVLVVQPEDLLGVRDQANLPGTTDEHPNWRRKLPVALERIGDDERFVALARALAALRGEPRVARPERVGAATARIPRATYRLQLTRDFTFAHATALVPYLAALGVSHVYCSPYLRARPSSTHGYDIVDHTALNPEIGGREDFERFVAVLHDHGMGQILDMVPNHMGVMGADNVWWLDVLENGPASAYAEYFDIDWHPVNVALAGRVLVPVLSDHYGLVLERGELRLAFDAPGGSISVFYSEHRFPVDPREYPRILERALRDLASGEIPDAVATELSSLSAALGHLPARDDTAPERVAERNRDKEVHKRRLARLVEEAPRVGEAIAWALRQLNGTIGDRASFEPLHELLEAQAYRLAYWRVASDEINYRRFFDINELAGLRMEREAVFEATHRFVLRLAVEGKIDGIRLDHPDGLYDPAQYFLRIQNRYAQLAGVESAPGSDGRPARPLYVVVEKITAGHERVPESWAVHGTTGYRFATVVNGLCVDAAARGKLDRIYRAFIGEDLAFPEVAYRSKRAIMRAALAAELTVLATELLRIAHADRRTRDFTFNTLRQALTEVVACFPVYRTYIAEAASVQDRRHIDWAIAHAKRRSRAADVTIFDFVRSALLGRAPKDAPAELKTRVRAFAMKFQQFTGPVAAKGVEDTAFYVYHRLVSLNEVGGDPELFGVTVAAFHGASADRAARWPHTMLATSTHDNKRSEDVRARIDVLSEIPAAWRLLLRRWSRMNRGRKRTVDGVPAPSRNDEYLLYQTLLGTFPAGDFDAERLAEYRDRIARYMVKAVREAKVQSSWISVSEPYETATAEFVQQLLGRSDGNLFLEDLVAQVRAIGWFGLLNSLSMTLIKLASPGVPDIYQGNETLDFSLVDPDNRRPVDYARRRGMLEELKELARNAQSRPHGLAHVARAMANAPENGRAKLWTTWRTLELRREQPQLFERGDYVALAATGARARHVVGFARRFNGGAVIAVAGRLWASLGVDAGTPPLGDAVWGDTYLSLEPLTAASCQPVNVLTGEALEAEDGRLRLGAVFSHFPAGLIVIAGRNDAAQEQGARAPR